MTGGVFTYCLVDEGGLLVEEGLASRLLLFSLSRKLGLGRAVVLGFPVVVVAAIGADASLMTKQRCECS